LQPQPAPSLTGKPNLLCPKPAFWEEASPAIAPAEQSRRKRSHMPNTAQQNELANAIRSLAMDAVEKANSGHPGLPMGCADIATVLFTKVMKFDPSQPHWPDRDRFILSAGHGSMLLYSALYLLGYEDMTIDEVKN